MLKALSNVLDISSVTARVAQHPLKSQGFPQVLQTWGGAPQNLMLKMLLKNTSEGVHLIKKLPAISQQASKFTKNELLHTSFSNILARF